MRKLLAPLVAAVAVVALAAAPAMAAQDTFAVAENTVDGQALTALAFDVVTDSDGVIDQRNTAYAYASCEDCRTAAVSFQVVVVSGEARQVTPENVALAVNEECSTCRTLASAQQFVVGGGSRTRLTEDGRDELEDVEESLEDELERFEEGRITVEQLDARVDALAAEVDRILDTELRNSRGSTDHVDDDSEVEDGDGDD